MLDFLSGPASETLVRDNIPKSSGKYISMRQVSFSKEDIYFKVMLISGQKKTGMILRNPEYLATHIKYVARENLCTEKFLKLL